MYAFKLCYEMGVLGRMFKTANQNIIETNKRAIDEKYTEDSHKRNELKLKSAQTIQYFVRRYLLYKQIKHSITVLKNYLVTKQTMRVFQNLKHLNKLSNNNYKLSVL